MHQRIHRYVPAVDGLRAIAVVAVIIFHVDFLQILPGGFTGVDMFFVISGYVISQSLSGRRDLGLAAYLLDFYHRRLLRILPGLLTVLLVSFVVSAMFVPAIWLSEQNNRTGLAAFAGLSNLVLAWNTNTYFSPAAELNPYLHTWSLGVEEQFYVVFPLVYFAWLRWGNRSGVARAALPVLALASLAISVWQTQAAPLSAFYLLPGRFWELAAGALLFQVVGTGRLARLDGRLVSSMLPTGLALVTAGFLFAGREHFPFPWALATVLGTALMIAAVVMRTGEPASSCQRALQWPVVTYIGRLSYSLYLWHWPVVVFLRWTTGTELLAVQLAYPVIVVALAAASYHWIEKPLRGGKLALARRAWTTMAAGVAAVFVCGYAALWTTENPASLAMGQTQDTYTWQSRKHKPREPVGLIDEPAVQGRQIFAVGDSHTAAYRTMLKIVSLKFGAGVIEHEGCGVVRLMAADRPDCAAFREAALKDIEARARPGDIVFLASLRMPELAGRNWEHEDAAFGEAQSELTAESIKGAQRSAQATLTRLEAAQVRILIEAPIPLYKAPPNRCSDWFNAMNPVCAPGRTVARARLEQLRAPQLELLASLQQDHPALRVWDPLPILCPDSTCSAYDNQGKPLYFDADHLSGHGNRVLEPSFSDTVLAIWRE